MSGTSTRSAVLVGAACALAALLPIATGAPQDPPSDPISPKLNVPKSRLAIDGYDPVAYFPEGGAEPRKGEKNLTVNYRGATYRFATEANRERFRHEPSKYEPAYGGWCAYAMASDDRVEIDPKSFLIEDGSLLLFYDGFFSDTRKSWLKEGPDELRPKADSNWSDFADEGRNRDVAAFALGDDGLALGGLDPVAYFGDGGAAKEGDAKLAVTHRGATYRFANAANRDAFLAAPAAYEPDFGGWDANAMARGERVAADPKVFAIDGRGRLVLFAAPSDGADDPRATWRSGGAALAEKATKNWQRIRAEVRAELERAKKGAGG